MLKMLCCVFFLVSLIGFGSSQPDWRDDSLFAVYTVPEKIKAEGYEAERHEVITEDGYILEMHRIPFGRNQTRETNRDQQRPVVFLMHGLLSASVSYVVLGHEYSMAYNYADAGFDVWMGNARGNRLSRRHVTLNPDDKKEKMQFFDFSWEEIAIYDVAGMIDYILEHTGQEKLHYIGHSQGGTAFLVLASMRPEYNEKFTSVHLLAGVGYQEYFPHVLYKTLAKFSDEIYKMAQAVGFVEMFPPIFDSILPQNGTNYAEYCTGDLETKYLCDLIGADALLKETVADRLSILKLFGGAALKQIAHYGQNIRDKEFRRWNYGQSGNIEVYGQSDPPKYNLSLITANVTMHYTVNDNLLDERDVLAMAADMPNTVVRKVARTTFQHVDFATATDCRELVTDYITDFMVAFDKKT